MRRSPKGVSSVLLTLLYFDNDAASPIVELDTGYSVNARVKNCFNTRRWRKYVHVCAAKRAAFYTSDDRTDSIRYDGEDLVVKFAFMKIDSAEHFLSDLQELNDEDSDTDVVVDLKVKAYSAPLEICSFVNKSHYRVGEFGSPAASISVSSEVSIAPANSMMAKFQSIEQPEFLNLVGFLKCRLKSACECTGSEKNDPNNVICLSPNLRSTFNGFRTTAPWMRIEATSFDDSPISFTTADGGTETRKRVNLKMEFRSKEVARRVFERMKDGSVQRSECLFETFAYVIDPVQFMSFVDWKYQDTTNRWA